MTHEQILIMLKETNQKLDILQKSQAYQNLEKSDGFRFTNLSLCEVIDALSEIEEMISDIPYLPIYEEIDNLNLKQLSELTVLTVVKVHRETMTSFWELYKQFGYFDVPKTLVMAIDCLFSLSDYNKLSAELTQKLSNTNVSMHIDGIG